MAFDFSEIWKCKKNFAVNVPPLDYDVDAQRGWTGIMDACYLIDNLYNLTFSGTADPIEPTTWEDHMMRMHGILPTLYDYSHDGRMTKEGLQGEHADGGVVMMQLNKRLQDAEKPKWQLEVDPFTRYEPLAKLAADKYKGARALENKHPVVERQLALLLRARPDGVNVFCAKKLLSVSGKVVPTANAQHHVQQQNSK